MAVTVYGSDSQSVKPANPNEGMEVPYESGFTRESLWGLEGRLEIKNMWLILDEHEKGKFYQLLSKFYGGRKGHAFALDKPAIAEPSDVIFNFEKVAISPKPGLKGEQVLIRQNKYRLCLKPVGTQGSKFYIDNNKVLAVPNGKIEAELNALAAEVLARNEQRKKEMIAEIDATPFGQRLLKNGFTRREGAGAENLFRDSIELGQALEILQIKKTDLRGIPSSPPDSFLRQVKVGDGKYHALLRYTENNGVLRGQVTDTLPVDVMIWIPYQTIAGATVYGKLKAVDYNSPDGGHRKVWVLELDTPEYFTGDKFQYGRYVSEIQVNYKGGQEELESALAKRVRVSGKLFGKHTAEHIRPVIVDVESKENLVVIPAPVNE